MQTIDRVMQITAVLAGHESKKWFSITDLSKECELPVSTMHRLLQSMKEHGLIQQDSESKFYSLGNTWLEYGLQMYDSFDFVGLIRPQMEKLMLEVEESVYFSKPIGLESLIVERIDCQHNPIRINDQLGIRIPMPIGAANKVILAHMQEEELQKHLPKLVPHGEGESLVHLLEKVRHQGYGESHNEKTEGTSSVASPVFNHSGELLGVLSIGFVNFNLTEDRKKFLIQKVIEYGLRISTTLGHKA